MSEDKDEREDLNQNKKETETQHPGYMDFAQKARAIQDLPEGPAEKTQERRSLSEELEAFRKNSSEQNAEATLPPKELYYRETVRKKKSGQIFRRVLATVVAAAICGGLFGGLGYAIGKNKGGQAVVASSNANENVVQTASSTYSAETKSAISVIKNVADSVVNIKTVVKGQQTTYFGYSVPYEAESAGSGVIFYQDDEKVYIATNNHVIEDATNIYVTLGNDTEVEGALAGTDTTADVAVVSVTKEALKSAGINDVTVAVFGDSDNLEVGESVIVIGNALGMGQTSTGGMISAMGKEINVNGLTLAVIQTDAAINPGNSGGALINYNGEVVGIPTAKSFSNEAEGMGYALPSNVVVPILDEIVKTGTVEKPYLGVAGEDITEEISERYNLPIGALVTQVVDNSAAATAGLQKGDIIVSVDDSEIKTFEDLQKAITSHKVGDTISLEIVRNSTNHMTLSATLQNANS